MTTIDLGRAPHAGSERRSCGLWASIGQLLTRLTKRHRERQTLIAMARMDAYMLRDMGLEPQDVYNALDGRQSSLLFNSIRRDRQDRNDLEH